MTRDSSDEHYVLELCEEVLGQPAIRQHRFDWLRGDPSPRSGRRVMLPVDGFWPNLGLVVEVHEPQHAEPSAFFDKVERMTVSGVHRGEQRRKYDQRRATEIPRHGFRLVILRSTDFKMKRSKIDRHRAADLEVVRAALG